MQISYFIKITILLNILNISNTDKKTVELEHIPERPITEFLFTWNFSKSIIVVFVFNLKEAKIQNPPEEDVLENGKYHWDFNGGQLDVFTVVFERGFTNCKESLVELEKLSFSHSDSIKLCDPNTFFFTNPRGFIIKIPKIEIKGKDIDHVPSYDKPMYTLSTNLLLSNITTIVRPDGVTSLYLEKANEFKLVLGLGEFEYIKSTDDNKEIIQNIIKKAFDSKESDQPEE